MINEVPEELMNQFLEEHPNAKVLDYRENQTEILSSKTIYWEEVNMLGVYSKNILINIKHEFTTDEYMTVGQIENLIKKSKFFKGE